MKNIGLKVVCGALVCGALFGVGNVSAYEYDTTSVFRAEYKEGGQDKTAYLRPGAETCVKSDVLQAHYIYFWNEPSREKLEDWPGIVMDEDVRDGVYCYMYPADGVEDFYNYVIFDDNDGKHQTIDLSVVNDSGNLVKSLVYLFDVGDETVVNNQTRYAGRWAVNDVSALESMVAEAKALNPDDYTIDSYAAVVAELGSNVAVEDVTEENQGEYSLKADYISKLDLDNDVLGKLIIQSDGSNYQSEYLEAYNALGEALNNLVERKVIIIDDGIQNGDVTAVYKANSDSEIEIEATPDSGYELESITVKAILSYDEFDNPVLGDPTDIEIEPGETKYGYAFGDSDVKGVYITATFKAEPTEEPVEDSEDSVEDEGDIAVPDTGKEQNISQMITGSLIGCVSIGAVLGGVLGFINRKKISGYLNK